MRAVSVEPVAAFRVTVLLVAHRHRQYIRLDQRGQDADSRIVLRWLERAVKRADLKPIAWPVIAWDDSASDYFIRNQCLWRASVVAQ